MLSVFCRLLSRGFAECQIKPSVKKNDCDGSFPLMSALQSSKVSFKKIVPSALIWLSAKVSKSLFSKTLGQVPPRQALRKDSIFFLEKMPSATWAGSLDKDFFKK